ncbi:HEAT repeat domain-containing protein [Corallococcus sp. M34]|uniref:HEAT repeat domain-containing protein n=1 Tax=Citreicoccus inhibens TaxID=2849499 RepID=UPI001C221397|nr:HEAT repeat domain-containing protein [Citreicoccus inhibens]MBU8895932.1 HEAT repeat domain-containing protein [Citreicoccus inhibens]
MSDERPDALLRSALEKIVYFEARAEQLHGELDGTREEIEHLKRELAEARQRDLEMRRELAELEVRTGRMQAERDELSRLNQALRLERDQLMGKLLDASRIHASGMSRDVDDELGFDLASFISQLRSEAILRGETAPVLVPAAKGAAVPWGPVPDAVAPAPASGNAAVALSPVAREAQRLLQEGRLRVSAEQLAELSAHGGFAGSSDETLFGFSVRELSATDGAARVRAAERLKALAQPAAAPALAAALHAETDPAAQVALLQAFAGLCKEQGASVVSPLLSSPVPEVRIAALKAMLTLAPRDAAPHLAQAMKDPDRSVRRRASLLALGLEGETARRLGEEAIHDADTEVRSLAALALGAGAGENARVLLLGALDDAEPRVRKAAAQSLSRILGQDVSFVVALDDAHRRREIRRLATLPIRPVRARLEAPLIAKRAPLGVSEGAASVEAPASAQAEAARGAGRPVAAQAVMAQATVSVPAGAHAVGAQAPVAMVQSAHAVSAQAPAAMMQGAHAVGAQTPVANAQGAHVAGAVQAPAAGMLGAAVGARMPAQGSHAVMSQAPSVAAPGAPRAGAVPPHANAGARPPVAGSSLPPAPAQPVPMSGGAQRSPAARLSPVQAALVAMGATPPVVRAPAPEPRAPESRPGPSPVESLCAAMLSEVRVAVRGRSLVELAGGLSSPAELTQEALALLVARGAIVRRGHKYFAA